MRRIKELYADKRLFKVKIGGDGGVGYLLTDDNNISKAARVQWTFNGGWDHVIVSHPTKCPTWEEMCMAKEIFFEDNECCIEYYPSKEKSAEDNPYCRHIWKPQRFSIPTPPKRYGKDDNKQM